jgi:hypothetical protein
VTGVTQPTRVAKILRSGRALIITRRLIDIADPFKMAVRRCEKRGEG